MSYKSYRENLAREFYEKHSKSTEKQIALLHDSKLTPEDVAEKMSVIRDEYCSELDDALQSMKFRLSRNIKIQHKNILSTSHSISKIKTSVISHYDELIQKLNEDNNFKSEIKNIEGNITNLNNEQTENKTLKEQKQKSYDTITGEIEKLKKEIENLKNKKIQKQKSLNNKKSRISNLTNEINSDQGGNDLLEQYFEDIKDKLAGILGIEKNDIEILYCDSGENGEILEFKIGGNCNLDLLSDYPFGEEIMELKTKMAKREASRKKRIDDLEKLKNDEQNFSTDIDSISQLIEEKELEIIKKEEIQKNLEIEIKSLEDMSEKISNKIKSLRDALNELKIKNSQISQKITKLKDRKNNLSSALDESIQSMRIIANSLLKLYEEEPTYLSKNELLNDIKNSISRPNSQDDFTLKYNDYLNTYVRKKNRYDSKTFVEGVKIRCLLKSYLRYLNDNIESFDRDLENGNNTTKSLQNYNTYVMSLNENSLKNLGISDYNKDDYDLYIDELIKGSKKMLPMDIDELKEFLLGDKNVSTEDLITYIYGEKKHEKRPRINSTPKISGTIVKYKGGDYNLDNQEQKEYLEKIDAIKLSDTWYDLTYKDTRIFERYLTCTEEKRKNLKIEGILFDKLKGWQKLCWFFLYSKKNQDYFDDETKEFEKNKALEEMLNSILEVKCPGFIKTIMSLSKDNIEDFCKILKIINYNYACPLISHYSKDIINLYNKCTNEESKIALLKDLSGPVLYCIGNNKNGINELDRIIKKLKIIPNLKISNTHSTMHEKMQILERWGLNEFHDSWQIDCSSDDFKA